MINKVTKKYKYLKKKFKWSGNKSKKMSQKSRLLIHIPSITLLHKLSWAHQKEE